MALQMKCIPLEKDLLNSLINYVLYNEKDGWAAYKLDIITERELRNLLMAHSATRISQSNNICEPNCSTYVTKELCDNFEYALFGRLAKLNSIDLLEPWEKP